MEPHERIRYVFYNLFRKLMIPIGHDFLQEGGFKPNTYTFFVYLVDLLGFICCIYTLIWYDVSTGLNSIGYGAVTVQLVARIFLMIHAEMITIGINRIISAYEANAKTKSRQRALLLRNMSWISELILVGGLIAYMNAMVLHFINPIYGYFCQHEFKPLFPMYIPFVDEKTTIGFAILITNQSIEIFFALLSSASADFSFMIIALNVWIFSTIFKDTVNELNAIFRKKKVKLLLAKTKLRNICEMYYDIWISIDDINTIYFVNTFVVVLCAGVAAAVELFTCIAIGLIPASYLAAIYLAQIISYCAIGTIIELCNDQMTGSLTHCDWYLLPIDEQMKFKFLVMHVSMDKTLTLGGIRPLNMDTCVSILKTIYSYVMILHRIIK